MKIFYTFKEAPAQEVLDLIESHKAAGNVVSVVDFSEAVDYEAFIEQMEECGLLMSC